MFEMNCLSFELTVFSSFVHCAIFALAFVGSLYVWKSSVDRDHPTIVKKRFASVLTVCVLIPVVLRQIGTTNNCSNEFSFTLWEWLGVKLTGAFMAIVLSLFLTMVLFLGPLAVQYKDGLLHLYIEKEHWLDCFKDIYWWRSHIMAPFSEEFIFRACMLPLLASSMGSVKAIMFCPLLFGIAHLHHVIEMVNQGKPLTSALITCFCQFGYTTVFGIYSGFLFVRSGHLAAPVIAHIFCNHMGFPDFGGVLSYRDSNTRLVLIMSYVTGMICWCLLLFPLTNPQLYHNTVYT